MDDKTRRVLQGINAKSATRIKGDLTKIEVDTEGEEMVQERLKREGHNISPKSRKALEKAIERGDFRHEEEVLNDKTTDEIDKYQRREVDRAIKSGEIPDPSDDPFVKARNQRMKKRSFSVVGQAVIKPGINRALVEPMADPFKKKSLILVSREERKVTIYGRVLALGHRVSKTGTELPWEIEVGDTVGYGNYGYDEIEQSDIVVHVVEDASFLFRLV